MKFLIAHEKIYPLCEKPDFQSNILLVKNAQETEKALAKDHYDVFICHLSLPGCTPNAEGWITNLKKRRVQLPQILSIVSIPRTESPSYQEIYEIFIQNSGYPDKVYKQLCELIKPYCKKILTQQFRRDIISPLLPLHLSLQAFFGISRDISEKSEVKSEKEEGGTENKKIEFVRFGTRKDKNNGVLKEIYNNDIRKQLTEGKEDIINKKFLELFPNTDAFLLIEEAEWDFYASIFDMVLGPDDKADGAGVAEKFDNDNTIQEEKDMYGKPNSDKHTIAEMLGKIDKTKLEDFIGAFNEPIPDEWSEVQIKFSDSKDSSAWFNIVIKDNKYINVFPALFVSCLRELTAILANTIEKDRNCCKENIYFGYKGKYGKNGKNNHRGKVLQGLGEDFSKSHCKLEEEKDNKIFGYDKTLKKQIAKWDIEKAMVVIAGIEEMAKVLTADERRE